jgi:hypothetical protein
MGQVHMFFIELIQQLKITVAISSVNFYYSLEGGSYVVVAAGIKSAENG